MNRTTIKEIFDKIAEIPHFIVFVILSFYFRTTKKDKSKKYLLLIKTDAIGDYILFRNYLPLVKNHYKDYHISFLGSQQWQELAMNLDNDFFDEFVAVNILNFMTSIKYQYNILKQLSTRHYEIIIHPTFSRDAWIDQLVFSISAKHKIGNQGDLSSTRKIYKLFSDMIYTKLIDDDMSNQIVFEFYRHKLFFKKLLNISSLNLDLEIKTETINSEKNEYAIIFPSSGKDFRNWNENNYSQIAMYLIKNYKYKIYICGSAHDSIKAQNILQYLNIEKAVDRTGKTNLPELIKLIANCELLITNDTCALHIGITLKKSGVCISNGNHYKRFLPYPKELNTYFKFVFPKELSNYKFGYGNKCDLDINLVTVSEVIEKINEIKGCKYANK